MEPTGQYGNSTSQNDIYHNLRNYAMMHPYNMLSQWPMDSGLNMPTDINTQSRPYTCYIPMSNAASMLVPTYTYQTYPNGSMCTYPYMGMPNQPSLFDIGSAMGNYYPYQVMGNSEMVPTYNGEYIALSTAIMTPPPPGERISHRVRPPGCKTVFVGSLPERITEDIIREAFSKCGEIDNIRMSKRNYCHVKFRNMESVDRALLFSGYLLKIENKDDVAYIGKLHVDYANARDDQHEYDCRKHFRNT